MTIPLLKILCGVLADHEETERISLIDADLDDDGLVLLCKVMEAMPGLLSFNFSKNRLTSYGLKSLSQVKTIPMRHSFLKFTDYSFLLVFFLFYFLCAFIITIIRA